MNTHRAPFTLWPADRFYWAVLDAPGIIRAGPLPEALLPELADQIPVPVEEVFAVATPTMSADGRIVVCAMRRSVLAEVAGARKFYPDSIPVSLGVKAEAHWLNFMVGAFRPREDKLRTIRLHAFRALLVLVAAGLLTTGLVRRASHARHRDDAARTRIAELAHRVGGDPATLELTLAPELERLRASAKAAGALAPPPDASITLARLLEAWPSGVPNRPQSLTVNPSGVLASVAVDGDASAFLAAVRPPEGWTLDEPRLNSASGITRVSLRFTVEPLDRTNSPGAMQ